MGPSSTLEELPERPPTPPKDTAQDVEDALDFLDDSNEVDRALEAKAPQQETHTPTKLSPVISSQESATTAAANAAKRVDFSPWTTVCRDTTGVRHHRTPTRRDIKPLKSILKLSTLPPPLTPDEVEKGLSYFSPKEPGSFAKMLKSVLQQLASSSTSARLDAYLAINGALKAYDNMPDARALDQNMDQIIQFVTRDSVWKEDSESMDINIVTQALKLACAVTCDSKHTKAISDEFRAFLVDRAIAVMESPEVPKAIVKIQMFLLAQQRYPSTVWTSSRAERCISALNTIDNKVSGNNVIATRLVIYQRLLYQARPVMLSSMRDWLDHVFHAMLSSVKDVRIRAIETGEKAALDLGAQYAASKGLSDMMSTQVEEGQSYCDYLSLRLQQMIDDKEMNIYVPQIWAVAVLFFRHKRLPLETWKGFKSWLLIIQKCLNKREAKLMRYSMLAWNKLVFVVQPDKNTSPAMLNLLGIPTAHALEKPNRDSKSKKLRPITLGGYYILLHYAFRPGLEFETLDKAWDGYVEPALLGLAKTGTAGRNSVCRILHGLFSVTAEVWDQDAALDGVDDDGTDESVDPEFIPMLPAKWVRTRLPRILKILEPCLAVSLWKPVDAFTNVDAAWTSLMQAISEAGRQEVKTSQELKEAIALLVKLFRSLWTTGKSKPAEADHSDWSQLMSQLLDNMVGALGQSVFAEEILARNRQDDVEAAPTPSHRQSKHHVSLQTPLVFLAGLFFNAPTEVAESYYGRLHSLLSNVSKSKASEAAKVELFQRSWQSLFKNYSATASPQVLASVWQQFAVCISEAVTPEPNTARRGLQGLKLEVESILSFLADGLQYTDADATTLASFITLYRATATLVQMEAGNGAAVYAVTEPFAKIFLAKGTAVVQTSTMKIAEQVVQTAPWVLSKQAFEQGRRALLGVSLPSNKAPFNPFENTLAMITELLLKTYGGSLEVRALGDVVDFVRTVRRFIREAPDTLYEHAVKVIQEGIAVWLADVGLKTGPNLNYAGVFNEIKALYNDIIHRLPDVILVEYTSANIITPLLVAGLSSPHKAIVNSTLVYWNATFGTLEYMNYLPELEAALRARQLDAEISLPGLTQEPGHIEPASLPPFFEPDDEDMSLGPMHPPRAPSIALPKPPTQTAYFTAPQPQPSAPSSSNAHPDSSRRKPHQLTKATKLRHNDSQIAFAPIESSPLPPPTLGTEESQHLTEHQKDKLLEQRQAALAFPDLSSSPMAQSTALQLAKNRQVDRRLDFSSGAVEERVEGGGEREQTPTGTPDARAEERSDYMGSSPTPKAAEKAAQEAPVVVEEAMDDAGDVEDVEDAQEIAQDPPSSPPREDENLTELPLAEADDVDGDGDTTMDETWEPTMASTALQPTKPAEENEEEEEEEAARELDPLPSDCVASNEQLHQEEDTALGNSSAQEQEPVVEATAPEDEVDAQPKHDQIEVDVEATEVPPSPIGPEQEPEQSQRPQPADYRQNFAASTTDEDDISRISNSFIAPPAPERNETASPAGSRRSRRTSAKRKRSESASTTTTTPRKRKNVSPYKNPVSYLTSFFRRSQSQQDDDSDMGEDIVVASSQPTYSPAIKRAAEETADEVDVPGTVHKKDAEPEVESSQIEADAAMPPPKRGRGRPRKSETPTSQPDSESQRSQPARKLKRTASALSNSTRASYNDEDEDERDVSVVKDTPAPRPRKTKRKHEGSDRFLIRESQEAEASSQADPESRPPSRSSQRTRSPKVLVPASRSSQQRDDESDEEPAGQMERQATPQQIAERPIATPKSILARLRGVLADCGKMILGSQEEREIDDVMFELRREVFSAGRRGREGA